LKDYEVVTVPDAAYLKEVCTLLGENVEDTGAPAQAKAEGLALDVTTG
jgi:hypothetical protein